MNFSAILDSIKTIIFINQHSAKKKKKVYHEGCPQKMSANPPITPDL